MGRAVYTKRLYINQINAVPPTLSHYLVLTVTNGKSLVALVDNRNH